MKKWILVLLALFLMIPAFAGADPYFKVEFAPVFANPDGSGKVVGPSMTVFNKTFAIGPPSDGRIDTNTGLYVPPYTPNIPYDFFGGISYWIKAQSGDSVAPTKQFVVQLEGSNEGLFDFIADGLWYNRDVADSSTPPGKELWADRITVGVYDVPFGSTPTVLTNSRLQDHILTDWPSYNPATTTLTAGWNNVPESGGGTPVVQSSFDASGLDVWFQSDEISVWALGYATEDQGLRIVTFYEGNDYPSKSGGGGNGGGGTAVPEPTTMFLYGLGFAGAGLYRRMRKSR